MKKFMTKLYNYDNELKYAQEDEEQEEDVSGTVFIESGEAEEIGSEETREIQDDEKTIIDIDMDIVVKKRKMNE